MTGIKEDDREILPVELLTPLTAEFYPDDSGFDYEEKADGTEYLGGRGFSTV